MDTYDGNLQDILKKAQNLSVELGSTSNIPQINRNIFQILEEGQNFLRKHKATTNESDVFKASLLLGQKGYTVPDADFEKYKGQSTPTTIDTTSDIDVEEFLKNERENDLINILENSKTLSEQKCDEYCERVIQNNWENEKRKLLLELGSFSPNMTGPLQKPQFQNSTIRVTQRSLLNQDFLNSTTLGGPASLTMDSIGTGLSTHLHMDRGRRPSCLDSLESAQASQLIAYNSTRATTSRRSDDLVGAAANCQLFTEWAQCSQVYGDEDVREMWGMLLNIVTRPNLSGNSAKIYRSSRKFQIRHIASTRHYLEQTYMDFVRSQLERFDPNRLRSARFGSADQSSDLADELGTDYSTLRQHCLTTVATSTCDYQVEGGTMDEVPVWMMIYTCTRTGAYQIAHKYSRTVRHIVGDYIYRALEVLAQKDQISVDGVGDDDDSAAAVVDDDEEIGRSLELEYRKSVKYSADPYKKACYCILGRLNFEETFSEVITNTDDYLWFKLCIARPDPEPGRNRSGPDRSETDSTLLFSDLQSSLLKQYGADYFRANEAPWLYFRILVTVAEFESAIQFLSTLQASTSSLAQAVNFAIALYEADLLQLAPKIEDDLVTENKASLGPSFNLNLSRIVGLYIRRFEAVDIEEALNYYFVLRYVMAKGPSFQEEGEDEGPEINMYVYNAARMIVETKNFDAIVGTFSVKDGVKIKDGIIDTLGVDVRQIVKRAATEFENKALYPQAIHLYQLSKDYSRLFTLLRTLLAGVLANPSQTLGSSTTLGLVSLANTVAQRYTEGNQDTATQMYPQQAGNFFLLLDLCKFFQAYLGENYDEALMVIEQLRLVPFDKSDVNYCVQNFSSLRDDVRNVMPEILVAVMTILCRKYKEIKSEQTGYLPSPFSPSSSFMANQTILPDQSAGSRAYVLQDLKEKANTLIKYPSLLPYRFTGDTNAKLVQLAQTMN